MKVREFLKTIEADGWYIVHTDGSYRQFKHPAKKGRVTVVGKPSADIDPGTLISMFRQAQIKRR